VSDRILVSGGSGAIGSALCRQLALNGDVPIIGFGKNRTQAKVLAEETGGQALALDLLDNDSIDTAIISLSKLEQLPTGLVIAASPAPELKPLGRLSSEDLEQQWRVNVLSAHRLLAGMIKHCFRPQKKGAIVAVLSSAMGNETKPAMAKMGAYVIAKYGLQGLMASTAAEYPWLSVNTISPGFTETPMLSVFDERFLESMRQADSKGRFSTPDEVSIEIMQLIRASL
jgi:NAD(P)-dependent dehydrogenase (short-subunit alcohol dehydrogenase family)